MWQYNAINTVIEQKKIRYYPGITYYIFFSQQY
jgi:hypothetical protein